MNVDTMIAMMSRLSQKMVNQEEFLCRLDSEIGDGDHGVTVARGFKEVEKMLESTSFSTPGAVLYETGKTLSEAMGGAIGPIIGSFFLAGEAFTQDEMGCHEFSAFLSGGLEQVCLTGGAIEGDRTLVDALAPGVRAFGEEEANFKKRNAGLITNTDADITACLRCAYEAAATGAKRTKEMMAKRGRARFLREKSIGYVDAGATTITLLFQFMLEYMEERNI